MGTFTEKHIGKMQDFLRDQGFYSSSISNRKFDSETIFAWKQYQSSIGIKPPFDSILPVDTNALPEDVIKYFDENDNVVDKQIEKDTSAYAAAPQEALLADPFQFQHLTSGDSSSYRPVADIPSVSTKPVQEPAKEVEAEHVSERDTEPTQEVPAETPVVSETISETAAPETIAEPEQENAPAETLASE